jgi:uncharacterized repeat protein (TIGR03803 family)
MTPEYNSKFLSNNTQLGCALVLTLICALTILAALPAQSQTFTVLHNFTGGADGSRPQTGTVDAGGNFYGTAPLGGQRGPNCQVLQCGLAFKLTEKNSAWILTPLYNFTGGTDGFEPNPGLIFGPDGALYGTTIYGGTGQGYGTVYKLQPSPSRCGSPLCQWQETILYSFTPSANNGGLPASGVTFDAAGDLYGPTTAGGGSGYCSEQGCGVVYELTPSGSGWSESVLYKFGGGDYGGLPNAPLIFDTAGNIYGTESLGGSYGSVYELTPSGSGWNGTVVYRFQLPADGEFPSGLLFYAGNVYGTTLGSNNGGGSVYELSFTGGQWVHYTLTSFDYQGEQPPAQSPMVKDAQGNLYGTTPGGGQYGQGSVFKLTPAGSGWTYTSLHDFDGTDGGAPTAVVLGPQGSLYGTTWGGGTFNQGVAFKIVP